MKSSDKNHFLLDISYFSSEEFSVFSWAVSSKCQIFWNVMATIYVTGLSHVLYWKDEKNLGQHLFTQIYSWAYLTILSINRGWKENNYLQLFSVVEVCIRLTSKRVFLDEIQSQKEDLYISWFHWRSCSLCSYGT